MNITELKKLVDDKYIVAQKHPEADLFIYNYTQNTQYEGLWNELTLSCRGVILDQNYKVIARPFRKFFNYEELKPNQIPNENFEVFEKMDGSLGILYWVNNKPQIATRGSFTSEQAIFATDLLHTKYINSISYLDQSKTYLFEIIYPQNRIVVDYGDEQKLVLLAIIDTQSGEEMLLENIGFEIVKKYDGFHDLTVLKQLEIENKEGFVVKFNGGFRLKIKFEEYVRLHRILTNLSTIDIWECLMKGNSFDDFLNNVPDEFFDWVKSTKILLESDYQLIEAQCRLDFKQFDDRKLAAEYFQKQKYPMILFKMMDEKKYDYIIWKLIKPKFSKAFKASV